MNEQEKDQEKEDYPTSSPKIIMDFGTCFKEMTNGGKFRRLEWEDIGVYLTLFDGKVMIFKPEDQQLHPLIVNDGDILAEDWVKILEW